LTKDALAGTKPFTVEEVLRDDHLKPGKIVYTVKNYGRSPGWVTSQWANAKIVSVINGLDDKPDYFSGKGSMAIPKCDDFLEPESDLKNEIFVSSDDIDTVASGTSFLYVYGIITYRDVWNKTHDTRFCFYWHAPQSGDLNPLGWYAEGPVGYSRQT